MTTKTKIAVDKTRMVPAGVEKVLELETPTFSLARENKVKKLMNTSQQQAHNRATVKAWEKSKELFKDAIANSKYNENTKKELNDLVLHNIANCFEQITNPKFQCNNASLNKAVFLLTKLKKELNLTEPDKKKIFTDPINELTDLIEENYENKGKDRDFNDIRVAGGGTKATQATMIISLLLMAIIAAVFSGLAFSNLDIDTDFDLDTDSTTDFPDAEIDPNLDSTEVELLDADSTTDLPDADQALNNLKKVGGAFAGIAAVGALGAGTGLAIKSGIDNYKINKANTLRRKSFQRHNDRIDESNESITEKLSKILGTELKEKQASVLNAIEKLGQAEKKLKTAEDVEEATKEVKEAEDVEEATKEVKEAEKEVKEAEKEVKEAEKALKDYSQKNKSVSSINRS